ncbi:hypothetical protein V5799_032396 [Amblyomma americanum]|uniref:Uncharacterized protein n=1 Tax=Amblyomma americanum TaxID=6943 RepID=A0AAQ4DRA7_AMBAM
MAAALPPGASPSQGSPAQAAPLADVPPPVDPAAFGADALPPPPPPIADTGEVPPAAAPPEAAGIQPAPGTFVTTTAADAPVAQVMIDPNKKEGPKKEFMAAVKSYEEIVGGNVIRGKMYLESKPQYEAGGPMGMGGGGFDRPMGMGYQGPMPYPPPMGMGGGYDRPPMGYDGQMGGYGYDRPPMGGYGYDRPPPDMYGAPRDRPYSPDRGRYPPDYDRPPMDRRERPRNQRDDDYYYDELPKGRSETRMPVKQESANRAERVIQKIRQDIEAFDKDEGGVEDATNVPGSKPSESMERKPRTGPTRALWKATDDYEDEPPPARRSPRQRSSSHRSRDDGDDYDDYDDKRRSRSKRSKSRHDYDDEDRPRRGRSRRDESSSSSSSDGRRQRRKRHDSDDYDRGRSSSRRRRDSEDYGDKRAKRSRSRSKRRDEEDGDRASPRPRKGKGGEGLVSRPTDDRNFMQAGMLYRYESQPLMLVKGDVYKKEEAAAPAQEAGQEGGQKEEEGAPQQARFLSPDQYQDFLLGVRAGRRPLGYPVRATPSAVAEELGRYHDFLGSVMPEDAPRDAMAAEVGKYHSFMLGAGNAPSRENKFTEFLLASDKGVARVVKPVPPAEAAQGAAGSRLPPGYQSFTVQAKPTVGAKLKEGAEGQQYHEFTVQAKPEQDEMARRSSSDNQFTMQTRPQRMPSRMKGERYEHMEDTPQLKTEWWSRAAGMYDDGRPPSRTRSMRGRRGLARSASPRMVSPRRKAYDDENGDAYQVTSLEMEGPISNQYAQMRISRRGRDPNRMYSATRRMSPNGYGGPPRRASPEMIGMGGMGMQLQGMQMQGMQGMQMQGMPMQGMPMQGMNMQPMGMQPMTMQPMGMPMQAMPMQAMPMQGMPVQYDPRSGRVPMRMDRRIHQILSQQPPGGRYNVPPMQVANAAMPVQAQDAMVFKYQIQNESRQRQADEGDSKEQGPATRDVLIETSKEVLVEKVLSSQEVQVAEKRVSKATSARVKTRSSAAATHDAGSKKNAEAQAEIEEQMPHVNFTRNPNYDSPPPGYPFPMGPFPGQSPMFPPAAPPQPVQTVSTTTVHTHQHHHHYHDDKKNYKIAYLLPRSGEVRRDQDRYEDQEPLGAAVGVQCLSLYERFMNWIYPETKQTEDVSLMTDADELDDRKRPGKKGKKAGKKGESEESKKGDKKGQGSESEAEAKAKAAEGADKDKKEGEGEEEKKKVPPVPPIPVNLPWQGHEYEYEEEIKPDGSRVGKYRYKGLGGAPKLPEEGATESIGMPSKEPVTFETTTTRMESDGQHFWQREIKPIPAGQRMEAMMPMKEMKGSHESYQRQVRQHPSMRSVSGPPRRSVQTTKKVHRSSEHGAVARAGGADNFVPEVQIRLDFGDTSDNSGSRGSKTKSDASAAWQPADMVVSYAHKSFDDKNMTDDEDEDDDDEMLPSGHVYGGHGSTKKLIRRGRKIRGMPNKEMMAYSMVVLVAVVGLALLITMTGHRSQARRTFGLDRHLVLNASKFKAFQAGPGSAAVRHLPRDYVKSACSDFYQFVCAHQNVTDSPRVVAHRALEDGVLGVIKGGSELSSTRSAPSTPRERASIYKKFVSEKNIDGKSFEKTLNMNVDQFFFVSYASSYCGNSPPAKPSHHSEVTNRDRHVFLHLTHFANETGVTRHRPNSKLNLRLRISDMPLITDV